MSRRIQIFDTTLRDGEQFPGSGLQPHEKAEIAEPLERLGVDVVEAGFPGSSPGDFEGVRAVASAVGRPTVAAFARARAEAGANQVECTANGLGERAGNASLEGVVVALRVHAERFGVENGVVTTEIAAASRLVSRLTGYPVQPTRAIVGAETCAHEAGIDQDGMLEDARTYRIIDPAEAGVRMTLPPGKRSGRHAFARVCAERGLTLAGEEPTRAFRRFKELADTGSAVVVDEVVEGVRA